MKQKLFTKNSFILLLAAGFLVSCMSSNSVSNLYVVHSSTGIAEGVVKNNIIVFIVAIIIVESCLLLASL